MSGLAILWSYETAKSFLNSICCDIIKKTADVSLNALCCDTIKKTACTCLVSFCCDMKNRAADVWNRLVVILKGQQLHHWICLFVILLKKGRYKSELAMLWYNITRTAGTCLNSLCCDIIKKTAGTFQNLLNFDFIIKQQLHVWIR